MLLPTLINQTEATPYTFDMLISQYADFRQLFTWQQNGITQDLTDYTAVWTATSLAGVTYTWDSFVKLSSTVPGLITLDIPGAITGGYNTDDPPVQHNLILISPDGYITRLLEGTVEINPGVSI